MKIFSKPMVWVIGALAGVGVATGAAFDSLPTNSKPIEDIVADLEKLGYVIAEASVDDGRWEIEAKKDNAGHELAVDPVTGKILSSHNETIQSVPAEGEMQLSAVLKSLDKHVYSPVLSVEYERGRWEIEAYRGKEKRELELDAKTGKILSDLSDH